VKDKVNNNLKVDADENNEKHYTNVSAKTHLNIIEVIAHNKGHAGPKCGRHRESFKG